jgi:hypothetical protein
MTADISPLPTPTILSRSAAPDLQIVYQKFEITVANTRLMLLGSEES